MKDMILNFVMNRLGAGKALDVLDGKKAYAGGVGLMLLGAGMILTDLVPVLAKKDSAALIAFCASLPAHPGAAKLLEGLSIVGLRHAAAKA